MPNNDYGDHRPSFSSDKDWKGWYAEGLRKAASMGYVGVAANYRPVSVVSSQTSYGFGAQLDDLRSALVWLMARAEEFGIDRNRIVVVGYGLAGGHLAQALAYDLPGESLSRPSHADGLPNFAALVAYGGVPDLERAHAFYKTLSPPGLASFWQVLDMGLMGDTPDVVPAHYAAASPLRFIDGHVPPTLVFFERTGYFFDDWLAEKAALEAADVRCRFVNGAEGFKAYSNYMTAPEFLQFLAEVVGTP